MKAATKPLEVHKIGIVSHTSHRIEATEAGTDVHHIVVVAGEIGRCISTGFSSYLGERGPHKHVLVVRKKYLIN